MPVSVYLSCNYEFPDKRYWDYLGGLPSNSGSRGIVAIARHYQKTGQLVITAKDQKRLREISIRFPTVGITTDIKKWMISAIVSSKIQI